MDTRSRILNAALQLFASKGYDAVGVQTIVEAVEITKPTLYHYFGSKRGLFETLVREHSGPLTEAVRVASDYHGDITQSISLVVRTYFEYASEHPVFYRMLLSMWFAPPSSEYFISVHDVLYQQYQYLEDMFTQAAADHGNMRGRHKLYTISLKGTIDIYIGMSLQGYVNLGDNGLVVRVIHQFMHGIFS